MSKTVYNYFPFFVSDSIKKLTIFETSTQKITHSRTTAQKWTQKWTVVVVFCRDNCFLFKKCVREAASPGISGHWNMILFEFGGSLFLKQFLERLCFTQNWNFWWKLIPKWSQNEDPRELFFRNNVKLKKCFWTAPAWTNCIWAHPMERSGQPKNWRIKDTYFRNIFFWQTLQKKYEK